MTETGGTTRITEVGTVIIPVSDQDRAIEFFVGTPGFEKRLDGPYGEGQRCVEVARRARPRRWRSFPRVRAVPPGSR